MFNSKLGWVAAQDRSVRKKEGAPIFRYLRVSKSRVKRRGAQRIPSKSSPSRRLRVGGVRRIVRLMLPQQPCVGK